MILEAQPPSPAPFSVEWELGQHVLTASGEASGPALGASLSTRHLLGGGAEDRIKGSGSLSSRTSESTGDEILSERFTMGVMGATQTVSRGIWPRLGGDMAGEA